MRTTRDVLLPAAAGVALGCSITAWALSPTSPKVLISKARTWLGRRWGVQASLVSPEDPAPWAQQEGPPRCRAISTVEQLLTWQPPPQHDPCSCTTSLQAAPGAPGRSSSKAGKSSSAEAETAAGQTVAASPDSSQPGRPQLLVCHDMMGGYLPEEVRPGGVDDPNRFRLWHWDCVDVFCYFSHQMVSIPPRAWTHAAHKHGVKVLGTFITEFAQGRQRCRRLFASHAAAEGVAEQLVAVALHHGFEGWLVNIENTLTAEQVGIMQHFVGYLRARMQAELPGQGLVVWYDAVTVRGELRWQNSLTPANAPFFDLADALFVNYNWTPARLPAAGGRMSEVFMGVDVHGRGSYGGGGYGVGLALAAAAVAGLSAALFAPGWVYENLDRSRFVELQEGWWNKVQAAWGLSHAVVHSLPFETSFNAGAGRGWFSRGSLLAQGTAAAAAAAAAAGAVFEPDEAAAGAEGGGRSGWFNMNVTDTLPSSRDPITQQVVSGPFVARLCCSTAFNGGSCLVICRQSPAQPQPQPQPGPTPDAAAVPSGVGCTSLPCPDGPSVLLQLFRTAVPVPAAGCRLRVTAMVATPAGGVPAGLRLWALVEQEQPGRVVRVLQAAGEPGAADAGESWQRFEAVGGDGGLTVLLPPAPEQPQQQTLGPLQFVQPAVRPAEGANAAASALAAVDGMWDRDLSGELKGWAWRELAGQIDVSDGQRITGLGVAVPADADEIVAVLGQLRFVLE